MKYIKAIVLFLFILISCDKHHPKDGIYADINTEKGKIIVQLFYEETPLTVANFISLADGSNSQVSDSLIGKKFYNGLPFHRVIPDFMIQGGDIQRNGMGSPGFTFADEFPKNDLGGLLYKHDSKGIMSMANSGPNTNGSQFFITHKETPWLNGKHTVFGSVTEGLNIIDSIQQGDKIISIDIVRKGKLAKKFDSNKTIKKAEKLALEKQALLKIKREKDSINFAIEMEESKAEVLSSGLKILHLTKGKGKRVQYGDVLKVHYKGYFVDGKVFDTSYKRQKPFKFTIGVDRVIEGWTEGMVKLNAGSKARLFIPYDLAYGADGYGIIPEKSKLIFEVEVIEIVK